MGGTELNLNLPKKRTMLIDSGFVRRTIAFFIDLLIIQFIIISPFKDLLRRLLPVGSLGDAYSMLGNGQTSSSVYAISFFIIIMIFLYFTFSEYVTGQSIGKKMMGLYVVSAEAGGRLSLSQVMLRNVALFPFFPFIIFWIVDPGFMMFTKTQRRLSDILSRTKVIQSVQCG